MNWKVKSLVAMSLIGALPLVVTPVLAAPGDGVSKHQRVQKQKVRQGPAVRSHQSAPARSAYRNHAWPDPSFDRSGRPYRPNFYSPCTVDLGYGRFADCNSWNN